MSYLQTFETTLPTVKNNDVSPNYYITYCEFKNESRLKLNKLARRVLKHYEMVEEARTNFKKGNVVTWDEFIANVAE